MTNWRSEIDRQLRAPNQKRMKELSALSNNWSTCAVGANNHSIQLDEKFRPIDKILCKYGGLFSRNISAAFALFGSTDDRNQYLSDALTVLGKIERRVQKLTKAKS